MSKWYFNDDISSRLGEILHSITAPIESLIAKVTGNKMTGAEEQAAALSFDNSQKLAEQDYERKIDFYERFESPEARVRQYKDAGLNPMLLAGNGASVSASGGVGAGSAPVQSSSGSALGGVLSAILGTVTKMQQINTERSLTSSQQDINRYQAETARIQATNYGAYLSALTTGQNQKNEVFYEAFGVDMQNKQADTKAKEAQASYLYEVAGSEVVRRSLMESGIRLNDSQTAMNEVQKAILKAQEKYSDRYFKSVAEISEYQSTIMAQDANVAERLGSKGKDFLYHRAVAECADMIFKAGMDLDIWEGDAFKQAVDGKMTKKDWTEVTMGVLKTILAGGAVVGATAIRSAARAVVPPMPSYSVPSYMSSPYGEPVINM